MPVSSRYRNRGTAWKRTSESRKEKSRRLEQAEEGQKDSDARWIKKDGQNHYDYKNHIDVDVKHKLIRSYAVTPASVYESQVFNVISRG